MKVWLAVVLIGPLVLRAAPAEKKLAVVATAFAQIDDGPAAAHDDQFVPGETLFFRCQVEGYKKSENNEIQLAYQVEAEDARGVKLLLPEKGVVKTTLSPEDKNWLPKIRYTVVIPPLAETGEYHVTVTVKDGLAGSSAETRATFLVQGRDVAPSDTLTVRNFRFYRGENDDKALDVPAYRPGDSLWGRFDMTGYKIGDKNLFDIGYGLVVLRVDGSVAYSQPEAANSKEAPFYPQRYQPGELSLNMPKDIAKGEYTIVLTVHDNLGQQTCEAREKFSIE
ncbi:MAG TPA: hypothetical protein VLW25_09960 [Bryobacteraceae bacterium]|nr:hypothetical protein [Bryobacteraceae bacterium]